jgi:hypothetical protein
MASSASEPPRLPGRARSWPSTSKSKGPCALMAHRWPPLGSCVSPAREGVPARQDAKACGVPPKKLNEFMTLTCERPGSASGSSRKCSHSGHLKKQAFGSFRRRRRSRGLRRSERPTAGGGLRGGPRPHRPRGVDCWAVAGAAVRGPRDAKGWEASSRLRGTARGSSWPRARAASVAPGRKAER